MSNIIKEKIKKEADVYGTLTQHLLKAQSSHLKISG